MGLFFRPGLSPGDSTDLELCDLELRKMLFFQGTTNLLPRLGRRPESSMLFRRVNVDKSHYLISGMGAFDLELAVFQQKILALEPDCQLTPGEFPGLKWFTVQSHDEGANKPRF